MNKLSLRLRLSALLVFIALLSAGAHAALPDREAAAADRPQGSAAPAANALASAPSPGGAELTAPSLQEATNSFVAALSRQPDFEAWKQAAWTSYALGPGTHGWVVIGKAEGKEIGYLVLHAAGPNTYRLTEYGKGPFPLFSMETLYRSLVRLELLDYSYRTERLYFDPLHPLWRVTVEGADRIWLLDAKTGEELPLEDNARLPAHSAADREAPFTITEQRHTLMESGQYAAFEPYARLPWVQGAPAAKPSFEALKRLLEAGGQPIYTIPLYDEAAFLPLPVTGFQQWSSGEAFIRVFQDDERYLPFELVNASGAFYP